MNFFRKEWKYLLRCLMCTLLIYCFSLASSADNIEEENAYSTHTEKVDQNDVPKTWNASTLIFEYDLYWVTRKIFVVLLLSYVICSGLFIRLWVEIKPVSSILWSVVVLAIFGLSLLGYIESRLDRFKMYIICQPGKITLNHQVIDTKNVGLAKVILNSSSDVKKVELYSKNDRIMYTLEARRMKKLDSVLALISFLRENNIRITYRSMA